MGNFPLDLLPTIPDDFSKMDARDAMAPDMTIVHNCLLRAINNIYIYADSVTVSEDIAGFTTYIEAFAHSTDYHHKGEEMFLFPALEKAGIPEAAATVGQHKAIHELVETLESFITDVKKDNSKYSAMALRKILDAYAADFHTHLEKEISTLNQTALRNAIEEAELRSLFDKELHWVVSSSNPLLMMPLTMGAHDRKTNPTWPPIPDEVRNAIPGMMDAFKSAWKYSPFDIVTGEPQTVS